MSEDETEQLANFKAGRLKPEEAESFESRLHSEPDLAAWASLADGIKAAEATAERSPGALGWARLSREIERDTAQEPPRARWQIPVWQAAAAVIVSLGLWQGLVTPLLDRDSTVAGYSTASGDSSAFLRVAFDPSATEAEIRSLLREVSGEIVSGPSAIGLYSISATDDTSLEALAEALNAHPDIIESATLP